MQQGKELRVAVVNADTVTWIMREILSQSERSTCHHRAWKTSARPDTCSPRGMSEIARAKWGFALAFKGFSIALRIPSPFADKNAFQKYNYILKINMASELRSQKNVPRERERETQPSARSVFLRAQAYDISKHSTIPELWMNEWMIHSSCSISFWIDLIGTTFN